METVLHFIASIFAPKNPMLSGMPAVVTVDKNNNCKIVIDNCAPYDVIIDRNDILALMDRETEQLQPLEDSVISAILTDIDNKLPKVPNYQRKEQEFFMQQLQNYYLLQRELDQTSYSRYHFLRQE